MGRTKSRQLSKTGHPPNLPESDEHDMPQSLYSAPVPDWDATTGRPAEGEGAEDAGIKDQEPTPEERKAAKDLAKTLKPFIEP